METFCNIWSNILESFDRFVNRCCPDNNDDMRYSLFTSDLHPSKQKEVYPEQYIFNEGYEDLGDYNPPSFVMEPIFQPTLVAPQDLVSSVYPDT